MGCLDAFLSPQGVGNDHIRVAVLGRKVDFGGRILAEETRVLIRVALGDGVEANLPVAWASWRSFFTPFG